MLLLIAVLLICLGVIALPARADISGPAEVINGDTLMIKGKRVGLYGVDAPQREQVCVRGGRPWPCGEAAAATLRDLVKGRFLWCRRMAGDYQERRSLAICYLGNGADTAELNAAMVESGMALAHRLYSRRYARVEAAAKAAERGLWAGRFVAPWEWRPGVRPDAAAEAPGTAGQRPPAGAAVAAEESRAPIPSQ